jgi:hypothetical protein
VFRVFDMSELVGLKTDVWVDADLDVDDDGKVNLIVLLDTTDEKDIVEVAIPFEKIVGDAVDIAQLDMSHETIRYLYTLAHEMTKTADYLYEVGQALEGSLASQV